MGCCCSQEAGPWVQEGSSQGNLVEDGWLDDPPVDTTNFLQEAPPSPLPNPFVDKVVGRERSNTSAPLQRSLTSPLMGTKAKTNEPGTPGKIRFRKKNTSIRRKNSKSMMSPVNFNRQQVAPKAEPLTKEVMGKWLKPNTGFKHLLASQAGRRLFDKFLLKEFSRENLQFWIACENVKDIIDEAEFEQHVDVIFKIYILPSALEEISLEGRVKESLMKRRSRPARDIFEEAQNKIYSLMHRDSFPRFVNSQIFKDAQEQLNREDISGTKTPSSISEDDKDRDEEGQIKAGTKDVVSEMRLVDQIANSTEHMLQQFVINELDQS